MYPDMLQKLKSRLDYYRTTMAPPRINLTDDPLSNPKLHNGVWEPWINLQIDFIYIVITKILKCGIFHARFFILNGL